MLSTKNRTQELVDRIKQFGTDLINNAEEIVGDATYVSDISISLNMDLSRVPEYDVMKTYISESFIKGEQ